MWERDCDSYSQFHKISRSQAKLFKCTAEHLLARQNGGTDSSQNVVVHAIGAIKEGIGENWRQVLLIIGKWCNKGCASVDGFAGQLQCTFETCPYLSSRMKNKKGLFPLINKPFLDAAPPLFINTLPVLATLDNSLKQLQKHPQSAEGYGFDYSSRIASL